LLHFVGSEAFLFLFIISLTSYMHATCTYFSHYSHVMQRVSNVQGVARGEGEWGHAPNRQLSDFYGKKLSLLGLFSLPQVFCGPQICQKCVGGRVPPQTQLWELTTLSRPPSRLERGTALPNLYPLGAFGAAILAPSALSFCGPQCKILATPLVTSARHYT